MYDSYMSLCWKCKNTNRHKCTWFDPKNPRPVDGWEAVRRDLFVQGRCIESYFVIGCPNFDFDERFEDDPASSIGVIMRNGKWVAYINRHKKYHHLGAFDTKEEAIAVRREAERRFRDA